MKKRKRRRRRRRKRRKRKKKSKRNFGLFSLEASKKYSNLLCSKLFANSKLAFAFAVPKNINDFRILRILFWKQSGIEFCETLTYWNQFRKREKANKHLR